MSGFSSKAELGGRLAVLSLVLYAPRAVNLLIRRFILLFLLAWLPLQAAATPWLAFKCEQHESGMHGAAAQHAGHGQHADAGDQNAADDDDSDASKGVHESCHHFSGAIHAIPIFAGATVAAGVAPHSPALVFDFIPDLLKRPPLAHLV